jgi:hypothetical protein
MINQDKQTIIVSVKKMAVLTLTIMTRLKASETST